MVKNVLPAAALLAVLGLFPFPAGAESDADAGDDGQLVALWLQGEALVGEGKVEAAFEVFSRALEMDKDQPRSWNYIGGIHFLRGDYLKALLDFKRQMNTPGTAWFDDVRKPLVSGYSRIELKTFTPVVTKTLYDETGIEIPEVDVVFWKQRSLAGLNFEKHGILTLSAKVNIPRRNAVIDIPIRRSVQRSYEVKVVLAAPPHPEK